METVKSSPDVWLIVDADPHPVLATTHEVGHALVFHERKIYAIACGLPVRRVHVKEHVRSIIALGAVEPRQILDVGAGEALPRGRQVLLDTQQVDGRAGGGRADQLPPPRISTTPWH